MVKGAAGILHTTGAPKVAPAPAPAASAKPKVATGQMAGMTHVQTTLGEMFVKADTTTATAGTVMCNVQNSGATTHGLAIVMAPGKAPGGMLDASAFIAKGQDLAPGASDMVTAQLEPGRYALVCFMPGHYAAGQKLPFVVR